MGSNKVIKQLEIIAYYNNNDYNITNKIINVNILRMDLYKD